MHLVRYPTSLVGLLALVSCGGPERPPAAPEPPRPPATEHLLYEPTGNAVELLGRAVKPGPDGQMVIAEERAPGCHVTPREVQSSWTREYEEDIGNVAFASASIPVLGELRGKYGRQIRTRAKIENRKELFADLSGSCGEVVIKSVKIGTGSRELEYRKHASGGGEVMVSGIGASGDAQDWERIGQSLRWSEAQAWAFTVGTVAGTESIRMTLEMPTELRDGDDYTLAVTAARQIWVIALYEEADGRVGILLPDPQTPDPVVVAGSSRPLPKMRVSLRNPAVAAREKLVLYGFTEKEDFEDFRPPAGAISEQEATEYYRSLAERLGALPRKRWVRSEISYLIKPK